MFEKHPSCQVTEIQGVYGPLQILESKVQQLWALQHLQGAEWRTQSDKRLIVHFSGHWNHGAGPDFKEADIELNGLRIMGDVEIHLYREDWWRHGHDVDPAYDNVVLHVVLFAGGMDRPLLTSDNKNPEEWIMGPWTREDVESVSGGSPGLFGEFVPELREWMESDIPGNIRSRLRVGMDRRWQDKVSMARCLLDAHGWIGGLHRMSLYYLGYPANRKAFFEMAEAHPPDEWRQVEFTRQLRQDWDGKVKWGHGRPANRAEARLRAYARLNACVPDWFDRLQDPDQSLRVELRDVLACPSGDPQTRSLRRLGKLPKWEKWIHQSVLKAQMNHPLVRRLWIDVFLPGLVAAGHVSPEEGVVLWVHGHPASFPESFREVLKLVGIGADPSYPLCNGWIQGILWLEDQLRLERVRSSLGQQSPMNTGRDA
mgnify:CR=1 FL=1